MRPLCFCLTSLGGTLSLLVAHTHSAVTRVSTRGWQGEPCLGDGSHLESDSACFGHYGCVLAQRGGRVNAAVVRLVTGPQRRRLGHWANSIFWISHVHSDLRAFALAMSPPGLALPPKSPQGPVFLSPRSTLHGHLPRGPFLSLACPS